MKEKFKMLGLLRILLIPLIILELVQYSWGDPLVSQSGMVPMQTAIPPAAVEEQGGKEKVGVSPLRKRQEDGLLTDDENTFNMLMESFPTAEPSSPDANVEGDVSSSAASEILSSDMSSPFATFTSNVQSPVVVFNGALQSEDSKTVEYGEDPQGASKSKNEEQSPNVVVVPQQSSNIVKADVLEEQIFQESLDENINRQVLPETPSGRAMDKNVISRQAGSSGSNKAKKPTEDEEVEQKHPLFQKPVNIPGDGDGAIPFYKPGPPWDDPKIVGEVKTDLPISPIEISFKVAAKLCQTRKRLVDNPALGQKQARYYLWAPINQYVPLIHKGYPIRPPVFAPACLKWVLRPCRGELRRPLVKPCTYWAPMPIRRPECGMSPKTKTKMVNYRPVDFVPGKCPCIWPCVRRFDPIQRCKIPIPVSELELDKIDSDGDPESEGEINIQETLAAQLCRSMKLSLTTRDVIPVGWIPIRIDSMDKSGSNRMIISTTSPTPEKNEDTSDTSEVFIKVRDKREAKRPPISEEDGFTSNPFRNRRKRSPDSGRKFYIPDVVMEEAAASRASSGLGGRTDSLKQNMEEEEAEEVKEGEEEEETDGFSFMAAYIPSQLIASRKTDSGSNLTLENSCIQWRYKACLKDAPKAVKGGNKDGDGTGSLGRRSAATTSTNQKRSSHHGHKRRKMLKRRAKRWNKLNKREDVITENEDGSIKEFEGSDKEDLPGAPCGEWHFTETIDCIPEVSAEEIVKKVNKVMITGVIESNESYEDNDDDEEEEASAGAKPAQTVKTVKDLCPGSPGKFPCFLRRKKRDVGTNKRKKRQGPKDKASTEGNKTAAVGDFNIPSELTQGASNWPTDDENDDDEEEAASEPSPEAQKPMKPDENKGGTGTTGGDDEEDLQSSSYFASTIQYPQDPGCMCDWPCLPFFDKINQCYNGPKGNEGKVKYRSFRRFQRDPMVCLNFLETDEIYCKVKAKNGVGLK